MKPLTAVLAVLLMAFFLPLSATAAGNELTAQLDAAGISYDRNAQGHLLMRMGLQQGRSQLTYIDPQAYPVGKAQFIQVWSIGWAGQQPPQWETALRLLEESQTAPVGGWAMVASERDHLLLYKMQLPANADLEALMAAIYSASFAADQLELNLSGEDRL